MGRKLASRRHSTMPRRSDARNSRSIHRPVQRLPLPGKDPISTATGEIMGLQLYHRWQCPYSARVRDFVEANALGDKVEFVEVTEVPKAASRLEQLTGSGQV